jgi:FkbM family methyltransferase
MGRGWRPAAAGTPVSRSATFRKMVPRMNDLKSRLGLLRSKLIYYGRPFNRRRLLRFYGQFVHPGALCFDIGAHVGNRTRAFLDNGARVVAVEPQPHCAAYLQRRFGRHERFTLIPKAIGAQTGAATLYINRINPTISTLAPASWRKAMADTAPWGERWDHRIEVDVVTLDQLIDQYGVPGFCKIDVEGCDDQALAGLSYPLPALSFEFISFERTKAWGCTQRLGSLGAYRFNWSFREQLRLVASDWVDSQRVEQMLQALGSRLVSGDIYAQRVS